MRSIGFRNFSALGALLLCFVFPVHAQTYRINSKVLEVLVHETAFGGCMARTGVTRPGCNAWVSFDCSGNFSTVRDAERRFEAAQLALVSGLTASITIDSNRRYNEQYCLAYDIRVQAQ